MALITRISRLFKADFHAVLDQIEEPEALLKQSIRDMDDDLAAREQRCKWLAREHAELQDRLGEIEQTSKQIDDELEVCFEAEKDDLARSLIKRKLELERLAKAISSRHSSTAKALNEQQRLLDRDRASLESMRQKAAVFTEHRHNYPDDALQTDIPNWLPGASPVSDDDVEVAFLRARKQRSAS